MHTGRVRWHSQKQQGRLTHADIDRTSYYRANATGQNKPWDLLHRQTTKVPHIGLSRATGHATGGQAAGLTATALRRPEISCDVANHEPHNWAARSHWPGRLLGSLHCVTMGVSVGDTIGVIMGDTIGDTMGDTTL